MRYTEFVEKVREEVEKLCPYDEVSVKKIVKNNSTEFYGIVIKKEGVNVSPTIYLDKYYEEYTCGRGIDNIVQEIVEMDSRSRFEIDVKVDTYCDYDKMKDLIMYKVINTKYNSEMLKNVPHRECLDLSIVYYCFVPDSADCVATWVISNEVMKLWGVDEEELFEKAMENCKRIMPYQIMSITDVICDILTKDETPKENMLEELFELEEGPKMYVVTNNNKTFGASAIAYPDVIIDFAKKHGDFYILPSSIHELIFIPASERVDEVELKYMVEEVNALHVPREEILSNEVYFYDAGENKLKKLIK